MTGPDLIRAVLESAGGDGSAQRDAAVRAFIAYQYQADRDVKFRQVELQNRLLDLFVDVPIGSPQSASTVKDHQRNLHRFEAISQRIVSANETTATRRQSERDRQPVGGAAFLLHSGTQRFFSRVVLEGAPGQGKSTVAQYLCQLHRIRLLDRPEASEQVPSSHLQSPRRLPMKVDLRDFAAWLAGRNPFLPESNVDPQPWPQRNLETFLAALVHYQSGGVEFTVADLHAVGRCSALLLVLDGLDEVADIVRRSDVVNEILLGINRLEANAQSVQVVVTSRPAAFANSPGMPPDQFVYFQLTAIDRAHINEYTEKWLRARRLEPREAAEVRIILKEKLDQPHLRDLARNPMQLAILLSLIHTRGSSLPDKRTSLYDSYVDLFFSREAEKSPTVRQHRDLLVNIHRYLAWVLHTASERGNDTGAIDEKRLRSTLEAYLSHEGHDPALVNELFAGMIERVVALVSRVQGTFEFEVQPLREYFAARYLYETAPYSPPGNEQRGTKPDRFDALARNFYWFNVARFYAGCYSKGELPSLIDGLSELSRDATFRRTSHPALLSATLLSDWVFTQHPRSVSTVIQIILGGLGLRYVVSSARRQSDSGYPLVLPKGCGQEELLAYAFSCLDAIPTRDYAIDLIDLIRANSAVDEIAARWRRSSSRDADHYYWIECALNLGMIHLLLVDELNELCEAGTVDVIEVVLRGKRYDFFEQSPAHFTLGADAIFNLDFSVIAQRREHPLEALAAASNPHRFASAFGESSNRMSLSEAWSDRFRLPPVGVPELAPEQQGWAIAHNCLSLIAKTVELAALPLSTWRSTIDPWDTWVEHGRAMFGERIIFAVIASLAAGIKSSSETCSDAPNLLDPTLSLCRRIRYARLRAGQRRWWERQFEATRNGDDVVLVGLTCLSWASINVLMQLAPMLDEYVDGLLDTQWRQLFRALNRTIGEARFSGATRSRTNDFDVPLGARLATVLYLRTHSQKLFQRHLSSYDNDDVAVVETQLSVALELISRGRVRWEEVLPLLKSTFARGATSPRFAFQQFVRRSGRQLMNVNTAEMIVDDAEKYPGFVVAAAQEVCRVAAATKIRPVGETAEAQLWFA